MVCRCLSFLLCIFLLVIPVFAVEGDLESGNDTSVNVTVDVPVYSEDDPLPVYVVPDEEAFQDYSENSITQYSVLDSVGIDDPTNPTFTGCYYVIGSDSQLGTITIYIPASVDPTYFGLTSSGYLVYVGSSSISCYLAGVRNNSLTFSSFGTGTYSLQAGSSYQSYTLNLVPTSSNLQIQDDVLDRYSFSELVPYMLVILGGVIFLCFMKR